MLWTCGEGELLISFNIKIDKSSFLHRTDTGLLYKVLICYTAYLEMVCLESNILFSRCDSGLPKWITCDFCQSSIPAWTLPVHIETYLRLCWSVFTTAAGRGPGNWPGRNLLRRYCYLCKQMDYSRHFIPSNHSIFSYLKLF